MLSMLAIRVYDAIHCQVGANTAHAEQEQITSFIVVLRSLRIGLQHKPGSV